MRNLQIFYSPEMRCDLTAERELSNWAEAAASLPSRKETNESERSNPVAGQEHGSDTDGAEAAQS